MRTARRSASLSPSLSHLFFSKQQCWANIDRITSVFALSCSTDLAQRLCVGVINYGWPWTLIIGSARGLRIRSRSFDKAVRLIHHGTDTLFCPKDLKRYWLIHSASTVLRAFAHSLQVLFLVSFIQNCFRTIFTIFCHTHQNMAPALLWGKKQILTF